MRSGARRALVPAGALPGATLHEDEGLTWFETPVRHLPSNGVLRIRLADTAPLERVLARLRGRGVDSWWCVTASTTPAGVGERLQALGLTPVERMNWMALDLADRTPAPAPEGVVVRVAEGEADVRAYARLTIDYGEVPPDEHEAVVRLHQHLDHAVHPGARLLAELDGRTVGKAYLSLAAPPGVAGIYGMSVRPEARGRGVAGGPASSRAAGPTCTPPPRCGPTRRGTAARGARTWR